MMQHRKKDWTPPVHIDMDLMARDNLAGALRKISEGAWYDAGKLVWETRNRMDDAAANLVVVCFSAHHAMLAKNPRGGEGDARAWLLSAKLAFSQSGRGDLREAMNGLVSDPAALEAAKAKVIGDYGIGEEKK
jgi:hypothetical protein